jgi:hypothetical protein
MKKNHLENLESRGLNNQKNYNPLVCSFRVCCHVGVWIEKSR